MSRCRVLVVLALLSSTVPLAPIQAAPNLVPNPSFETFTQCPSMINVVMGQIHFAPPWSRAAWTPDYFHECGLIASVRTPSNAFGSQCPIEPDPCGSSSLGAYGGINSYQPGTDGGECIQTPLSSQLQGAKKYRVRFWVSLGDFSRYAHDRIGACLTPQPVVPMNALLPLVPQVESAAGIPLADKVNWTLISGKFTAQGGEDNLVIGVFRPINQLTVQNLGANQPQPYSYYYVEEVSVKIADILFITAQASGSGGDMTTSLTNAPPNSPAWLYCGADLGGSEINGQGFDLGDPHLLAQATTDQDGNARFDWNMDRARPCLGSGWEFFVEARVDDASGESFDSNELDLPVVPTDLGEVPRSGARMYEITASPNPFNPSTEISYELLRGGLARVQVFDVAGREVRRLVDHGWRSSGRHSVHWDGRDSRGRALGAGVYYLRVTTAGHSTTAPAVLVK